MQAPDIAWLGIGMLYLVVNGDHVIQLLTNRTARAWRAALRVHVRLFQYIAKVETAGNTLHSAASYLTPCTGRTASDSTAA